MLYFYLMVAYFISFLIVLALGGYELYKDTKRDVSSLTWGVLVGFLVALTVPFINTLVAVIMSYTYLNDFFYELSLLMDKPIIKKKVDKDEQFEFPMVLFVFARTFTHTI